MLTVNVFAEMRPLPCRQCGIKGLRRFLVRASLLGCYLEMKIPLMTIALGASKFRMACSPRRRGGKGILWLIRMCRTKGDRNGGLNG